MYEPVGDVPLLVLPDSVDIAQCVPRVEWSTIEESVSASDELRLADPFVIISVGGR
ncbi:MAG: hypothetical protein BroJett007_20040 [Chloroflexota bacterium]|nr:MAG: hypothetical protein BroJett007_20040 [Chloroflexota bacterium]